jgi:hypothetical protein
VIVVALAGALPGPAVATPSLAAGARTRAATPAQRAAILAAFGGPRAAWPCLTVRLAASDSSFAAVRFRAARSCRRWAFNGVNVLERTRGRWKVVFEGSAYRCPLPRIPRGVQRDLRICR